MHIRGSLWVGLGVAALALLTLAPTWQTGVMAEGDNPVDSSSSLSTSAPAPAARAAPEPGAAAPIADEQPSQAVQPEKPVPPAGEKPPTDKTNEAVPEPGLVAPAADEQPSQAVEPQKPAPSAGTKPATREKARWYTVRRGDRLSRIAARLHVTSRALAKANGISTRHRLRPGERLRIPTTKAKAAAAPTTSVDSSRPLGTTALGYRGVPYRYAGMSARGMDCSGLVARVLQTHGIRAPHSSRALYGLGKPVSRAELKPDDLVFFRTGGRGISHVGIYLGNGQFVHASSGGGRVRVDTLDSGYYRGAWWGRAVCPP